MLGAGLGKGMGDDEREKEKNWRREFGRRLTLELGGRCKASASAIRTAAYNSTTGIVSGCTADGRVVLTQASSLGKINNANLSTVQLLGQSICRFAWVNNHEFVTAGAGDQLVLFNIVNLASSTIRGVRSTVYALKKRNEVVYAGSLDGRVALFDARSGLVEIGAAEHTLHGAAHPVSDLEVSSDLLYTATATRGRLWLWDLRNLRSKIRVLETGRYPCSVTLSPEGLYVLSDNTIIRTDQSLSRFETVYADRNESVFPRSHLEFISRHDFFAWNRKESLCLWEPGDTAVFPFPGLNGFERMGSDRLLFYTEDGCLAVGKAVHRFL